MKILLYLKNNFFKIVFIFFIYSFLGYFWEISKHFILYHNFVNRGMFYGPILPIYGVTAVLTMFILNRLRNKSILLFISCGTLCSLLEYIFSYIIELIYNLRWWNYYKYPFNLNGRTCLYSFIVFAIFGFLSIKYMIPFLEKLYDKLLKYNLKMFLLLFLLVFAIDFVYSATEPNTGKSISYEIKKDT